MRSGGIRRIRLVALAGTLGLLASACWTSYGSDYANTRTAKGETIITRANTATLRELWRIDGTVGSTSTPAVVGGTVFFGSWDGKLRAVAAADGSPLWTRQLSTSVVDDSP
ncbi:MAG: outer membrane protein assembly factor BamB family protein, partial [Acidimicrobiia bacterium]